MEDDSKIKSGFQIVQRCTMSKCKRGFSVLRDEGHLLDVQIKVNDATFDCHKVVLCAYSEYFKAMFTTARMKETKQNVVELQLLEPEYVKIAIDYMYSDQLTLSLENFCGVMTTAVYLQIDTLIQRFIQDIRRLIDVNSLMGVWAFTENYPKMCARVNTLCLNFALTNFQKVTDGVNFKEHPEGHILFSKVLRNNNFEVDNEETVIFAVINWIMFDPISRKKYLADILEYVRLPLLEKNVLNTVKQTFPLINEQPFCLFLEEAERYHADPGRQLDYTSLRTQLRSKMKDRCWSVLALLGVHIEDFGGEHDVLYELSIFDGEKSWLTTSHFLPFGYLPGSPATMCNYGQSEVYIADGENSCRFYCYRSDGSQSEELHEHQKRRSDHCLVAVRENLYLIGGTYFTNIPEEAHNDAERKIVAENEQTVKLFEPLVEVFNVPSKCWKSNCNMQVSVPVENSVAAVQEDKIYLLGTRLNSPPYDSGGDNHTVVQVINPRDESCEVLYSLEIDPPLSAVKFDEDIILCTHDSVLKFHPHSQPDSRLETISSIDMPVDFILHRPSCVVRSGKDLILFGDAQNSDGVSINKQWRKFDMSTKMLSTLDAPYMDNTGPFNVSIMDALVCPVIINRYLVDAYFALMH